MSEYKTRGSADENPLVSVVIPVYNIEDYLGDCLLSVTRQTYRNLEILIINDGSTDGSLAVAEKFAAADDRIRIVSKQNEGLVFARKTGIEESEGEYIYWIDGDDYSQLDTIERFMDAMERHGCDCAYGDWIKVRGDIGTIMPRPEAEVLSPGDFADAMLLDKIFATVTGKIYRRELLLNLKWYREVSMWEDFVFNIQVTANPDFKGMCFVPETYYYYMQRPESISKKRLSYEYIKYFIGVEEELFSQSDMLMSQYRGECIVNMVERHYVYVRVLSNPWRGDDELSRRIRDMIKQNKRLVRGKISFYMKWATLLYPCKGCHFIVKILATLRKWDSGIGKRCGKIVKYAVPPAGEDKFPEIISK